MQETVLVFMTVGGKGYWHQETRGQELCQISFRAQASPQSPKCPG